MRVRSYWFGLGVTVVVSLAAGALLAAPPAAVPVPGEVTIGGLSHWFGPVTLAHATHAEIAGDCISCHHHTDGEPTPCATCHGERADLSEPTMPSLKVAYHQQCVGCHRATESGPTACEGCHARKALPPGAPLHGGR